jgi:hypothetical protein
MAATGSKEKRRDILKKKVIIEEQNRKYYYPDGNEQCEVDILTPSSAVEVKSGQPSHLLKQLKKYSQVTVKEPIGYSPKIGYHNRKIISKEGYKVFPDIKGLRNYLILKGDGKKTQGEKIHGHHAIRFKKFH